MASITCTKCGAVLKTKAPVSAGKKLQCPKCEKVFVVEDEEEPAEEEDAGTEDERDEEEETPKPKKKAKAAKDDDEEEESKDEAEEDEEDSKSKKFKKKGKDGQAKQGLPMGLVLAAVGVLLVCLLTGGGAAGWYFFLRDAGTRKGPAVAEQKTNKTGADDGKVGNQDANNIKDEKKKIDKTKLDKKPVEPIVDFKMEAKALAAEFAVGAKSAQKKFKEKVVEITGEVDGFTDGTIHLNGVVRIRKEQAAILCTVVPDDLEEAMRVSRGQKVKLTGEFNFYDEGYILSIKKCRYAELEPSKILVASSESIAAEFETDANAAAAKYRNVTVILTGMIGESEYSKEGKTFIKLKGGKIRLTIPIFYLRSLGMLKAAKDEAPVEIRTNFNQPVLTNNEIMLGSGDVVRIKQADK